MSRAAESELKQQWVQTFNSLSEPSKEALKLALLQLRSHALVKSKYCWSKNKAPMAFYWKVVGVYAGHLARAISFQRIEKPSDFITGRKEVVNG